LSHDRGIEIEQEGFRYSDTRCYSLRGSLLLRQRDYYFALPLYVMEHCLHLN